MYKTMVVLLTGAMLGAGWVYTSAAPQELGVKKWQDDQGVWHYGDARPVSPDAATNSAAEAYRRGDYTTAFQEYLTWAKQGDPRAQNMIGLMYLRGQGVAQSQRIASEWLRRAAMQGNADAQFHLGILYACLLYTSRCV